MSAAHLHLLLNHFPIVAVLFALALLIAGLVRKEQVLLTAGKLATIAVGLTTIPTYLSGEPAEEIIEHMAGFSEELVHNHEAAALFALIFAIAAAVVATILLFKGKANRKAHIVLLVQLVHLFTVMAQVGNLGGQIAHAELRAASATTTATP